MIQQLQKILKETFGFQTFRPGQGEAIATLMQQGRLLCIQPTGYGKSLLYQLPAVLLDGITLVISPLLALMRDQLLQLNNRFNIAAASINTDQSEDENQAAREAALKQKIRILFIAPEQLDHIDKFNFLLTLPINLLVVDEAHCISTWGHDFRPSYRQIIKLAQGLAQKNPALKLLGITATANQKTEIDIKQQLTINKQEIKVHRESMDRPNIRLTVIPVMGISAKLATLTQLLKTLEGSGLIYCATRENTEIVAEYLSTQEIKITAYHAGMEVQHKRQIQQDFIEDKYPVIAATNALGMGIDKSNLRFIIHFDVPGSITAYYQEVGRAGRDGLPAEGILLYDPEDSKIQEYFIDSAQPNLADFQLVLEAIATIPTAPNLMTLKRLTGLHPTKLTVIIAELLEQEYVKKSSRGGLQVYLSTRKNGAPDLARYTTQFEVRTQELKTILQYAEQKRKCLMATLRTALGDSQVTSCKQCSGCTETLFKACLDRNLIVSISSWLSRRSIPIQLNKRIKYTVAGIAVLDGKLRSVDFIQFMRERTKNNAILSENLLQLIKACAYDLLRHHRLSCIIALPSRTWLGRDNIINLLASYLKIPALPHLLYWQEQPPSRQGELLNNDQRQHNVAQRLRARNDQKIPPGTILLLDDYVGSGATLNEAARAIRDYARSNQEIVPFTIAAVKWRLGKRGMI